MGLLDKLKRIFKSSKTIKVEEKELRWILLDFVRFKLIYKFLKEAQQNPTKAAELIKNASKLLRKEERTERRLAKGFTAMESAISKDLKKFDKKHSKKLAPFAGKVIKIRELLEKAEVFNADLKKEGARGGEIEKLLETSKESYSKLSETIKEVEKILKELKGFEIVIKELEKYTLKIEEGIEEDIIFDQYNQKAEKHLEEIVHISRVLNSNLSSFRDFLELSTKDISRSFKHFPKCPPTIDENTWVNRVIENQIIIIRTFDRDLEEIIAIEKYDSVSNCFKLKNMIIIVAKIKSYFDNQGVEGYHDLLNDFDPHNETFAKRIEEIQLLFERLFEQLENKEIKEGIKYAEKY